MIVNMQPWMLIGVVMNLCEDDVREFELACGDVDRQRWACERALAPGLAFAILDGNGMPVACCGALEEAQGRCTIWLVRTERWRCYVKTIAKVFRLVVKEGGYRRIQAMARPGRPGAAKFLKWLGFKLDGPLPAMCADGGPMELYSYT